MSCYFNQISDRWKTLYMGRDILRHCILSESICLFFRRYLALCVGETRVRFDLQIPLKPLVKKKDGKTSGKISVSPTKLRFLSQVCSGLFFLGFLTLIYTCLLQVISNCFAFSDVVFPHQLCQCDGAERSTFRVTMAHDGYRHHVVTGPSV